MRTTVLIFCFLSIMNSLPAQISADPSPDSDLIRQTIQTAYVEGLQNEGDTIKINQGFHPGFEMLIAGKNGELNKYPLNQWKSRIAADRASGKLPRKPGERISVKFLDVDVTGNAAIAKFEFYVGDRMTFMDYLLLYKYSDGWKIVSKIYYKF